MRSPRPGLLVGLLLVLESADVAWAQEFMPARFGDGRWLITSLVVPDARPPGAYDVSVTCQVIVELDGSTTTPHCVTDERYEAFRRQVMAAFDDAVVEPATVNGEPVRVLMSFMVGFRCLDVCSTLLLHNHGRHVDELGFAYSAPQPVLDNGTWYEGFEEKLVWAAGGRRADESGGVKFMVSTDINESGKASRRRIVQRSSRYRAEAARAVSTLNAVRDIPGFHEGQPLKLRLYEYWLDPNGALPDPISLPVRVHLLSSEFVDTLDAKIGESDVREFFDEVNSHWRPAGIRWEVESIVDVDAERQLAFRRITSGELAIDFTTEAYDVFSGLCPREQWLEGGWNVCFVNEFPWVSTHFGEGFVVVGEFDSRGEHVQPFALARELGETLGALDAPTCTSRFIQEDGDPNGAFQGACATTDIHRSQIEIVRLQAAKGEAACPRRLRRGGNWTRDGCHRRLPVPASILPDSRR